MNLENAFHELYDPLRQNVNYTMAGKLDESPFMEVEAESYDPIRNVAKVRPLASGAEASIDVRAQVHYAGAMPGTGEIFAIVPEERYKVAFIDGYRTGLFSCGEIIGTTYAAKSKPAPAYAPFQQQGVGRLVVDPIKPSFLFKKPDEKGPVLLGNADYTNDNSERYRTVVKEEEVEALHSEHVTLHGTNMPYAEEMIREATEAMRNAYKLLMS